MANRNSCSDSSFWFNLRCVFVLFLDKIHKGWIRIRNKSFRIRNTDFFWCYFSIFLCWILIQGENQWWRSIWIIIWIRILDPEIPHPDPHHWGKLVLIRIHSPAVNHKILYCISHGDDVYFQELVRLVDRTDQMAGHQAVSLSDGRPGYSSRWDWLITFHAASLVCCRTLWGWSWQNVSAP